MLITLLLASVAFACPQLAGNYRCQDPRSGEMTVNIQQSKSGFQTVYRYDFEGNPWLGDGLRVPVPYRWKQDDVTYTSACRGHEFSLTASRYDHAGKRFDTIERFAKIGERSLRYRYVYQNSALFDYSCKR